jgi:hypothetical protein
MSGEFCAACGQRRFRESDRRLSHLLGQAVEQITDLDGRFLRSLRALLLRPGRIARDAMDGRRARWMSPLSLFLLANVLFFFAPGLTDLTLGLDQQVPERVLGEFRTPPTPSVSTGADPQMHSRWTAAIARDALRRARDRELARGGTFDLPRYAAEYDARSDAVGKLLVIVHVPVVAFALMLLAWSSRRYFAEHLLLALTLVAFTMLFVQMVVMPAGHVYTWGLQLVGWESHGMPAAAKLILLAVNLTYFTIACRRAYDSGWVRAAVQGTGAFFAFGFASLFVYRGLQLLIALAGME